MNGTSRDVARFGMHQNTQKPGGCGINCKTGASTAGAGEKGDKGAGRGLRKSQTGTAGGQKKKTSMVKRERKT